MELNFNIKKDDFANAGKASSKIKKTLKLLNVDARVIKRIVVAVYEAEVNVVAHSVGGTLSCTFYENEIQVIVKDKGPGIENIEKAMTEGFSTASKKVREMGFGAGMGLPNIKRNTDRFQLDSKVGEGTTLTFWNTF